MPAWLTNWKTTAAGTGVLVSTILTTVLPVLPPQYGAIASGVLAFIGLLSAQDAK